MPRLQIRTCLTIVLALLCPTPLPAKDNETPKTREHVGAAEKEARQMVAQFDKGDPGWKVRMEALIRLVRAGPATVPVLVEALHKGPPSTREFAAQALVYFAEPSTRSALEQALADPTSGVRIYAILALSMLGPLPRTERHEQILRHDPNVFSVRTTMAAALARNDRPNPEELRKALADYDLRNLVSARLGEIAPDFTLMDFTGKTYRLSQFRGKKTVVLRFILFDF
jgi:HEAT repeat protein